MRTRSVLVVLLLLATLGAACSSSDTNTGNPTTPSTRPAIKNLWVSLGDNGLTFSPSKIAAAEYRITFRDRRSQRKAGEKVVLQFAPSGPRIVLVEVPAGTRRTGNILANEIAWVAIDGVRREFGGETGLTITTSQQFPTPAT